MLFCINTSHYYTPSIEILADPKINVKLEWPQGTYAIPEPRNGCPREWSDGWRLQSTEKKNRYQRGIEKRMRIRIKKKRIQTFYCVKTEQGSSDFEWSQGSYCIAKFERCPDKFQEGYIYWDDKNYKNRNKKWGTLPNGGYGRNTRVEYCCRNDGRHKNSILLPTDHPFILYRYGGRCQRVKGMRYTEYYVKWDDQNFRNKNKCRGSHPDSSCGRNQKLHFCYYRKK